MESQTALVDYFRSYFFSTACQLASQSSGYMLGLEFHASGILLYATPKGVLYTVYCDRDSVTIYA